MKKTAIHITKEASNTIIDNCEFEGFDIPIKNEGRGTKILNSIFKNAGKIWHEYFIFRLIVEVSVALIGAYLVYEFGWNK